MIGVSLVGWLLVMQDASVSAYAERAGLVEIERWALAETWRSTSGREREEAAVRYATVLADAFLSQPERAEDFREEATLLLESLPSHLRLGCDWKLNCWRQEPFRLNKPRPPHCVPSNRKMSCRLGLGSLRCWNKRNNC